MRQAAVLGLVLALVFGKDALTALRSIGGTGGVDGSAAPPVLDGDRGLSAGYRVHIAFCTS
jgi:hypothetical protein